MTQESKGQESKEKEDDKEDVEDKEEDAPFDDVTCTPWSVVTCTL